MIYVVGCLTHLASNTETDNFLPILTMNLLYSSSLGLDILLALYVAPAK